MELKKKLNVVPILQRPSDHERRNPILGPHIRIGKGLGTFLTLGRAVLTLHLTDLSVTSSVVRDSVCIGSSVLQDPIRQSSN